MSQLKSTIPIRTSRLVSQSPIYYGWIILFVGALGMIMTSPGQTYVISVVLEPLLRDLDMSRSLVSILYAVGTLVSGFALPLIGRGIDRYGTRSMAIGLIIISALSCFFMGIVQNVVMLTIAFVLLRLFTHGSLTLVSQNVINQWWIRRRGTVMGINGILWAIFGFGAFPILIRWLISDYGWRWTYSLQGVALLLVMLPLGGLLLRNRPEDYGLQPDGGPRPTADASDEDILEENWTLAEAIRTVAFWVVALAIAINGMMITGLFFHMESIFRDNHLDVGLASLVFVPIAFTNAVINLGGGLLADRLPVRYLLTAGMGLLAISLVMSLYLTGPTVAMIYGIVLGTTIGLGVIVQNVIWATYFGRQHLGSITGVATTVLIVGNALGPVPMGVARDVFGSYNQALFLLALLPLTLGLITLFLKKPTRA